MLNLCGADGEVLLTVGARLNNGTACSIPLFKVWNVYCFEINFNYTHPVSVASPKTAPVVIWSKLRFRLVFVFVITDNLSTVFGQRRVSLSFHQIPNKRIF